MIRCDYHTHTNFSDGKNTPEEMVLSAISMGLTDYGISDHAYTSFDLGYCIPRERIGEYKQTVLSLRDKYADRIRIWLGIEQDIYTELPAEGYDYVIGSVHYLKVGEEFFPVDGEPWKLEDVCKRHFGGDFYALADAYYDAVAGTVRRTGADIIGHFDLVTKFNEKYGYFDPADDHYRQAWKKAADALLPEGKPFEINTGAISRGWRTMPYPSAEICEYLRDQGAKFIFSSDSHAADTIAYRFDLLESLGILPELLPKIP